MSTTETNTENHNQVKHRTRDHIVFRPNGCIYNNTIPAPKAQRSQWELFGEVRRLELKTVRTRGTGNMLWDVRLCLLKMSEKLDQWSFTNIAAYRTAKHPIGHPKQGWHWDILTWKGYIWLGLNPWQRKTGNWTMLGVGELVFPRKRSQIGYLMPSD